MRAISYWAVAATMVTSVSTMGLTNAAYAQDAAEDQLLDRLTVLEAELQKLRDELAETKAQTVKTKKVAEKAAKKASKVEAAEEKVFPNSWHMAGYADTGMVFSDGENPGTFINGKFNPAIHFQYKDILQFESEFEVSTNSDGETDMILEYSQINLFLNDSMTLVAGKFLSPVGQFTERLHPSWINKMPDAPAGFGHGGIQPISNVGAMLRGGVEMMGGRLFTYSVAVGNGPRAGHDGVELEGFGRDDNKNKSVSGRVAFMPFDHFEVGGSFMTAKVAPEAEAAAEDDGHDEEETVLAEVTQGDFDLWGLDMAFTQGNWDIRGEYLNADFVQPGELEDGHDEEEESGPLSFEAWYVQAAYRLSGITDSSFIHKLEPVVRYNRFKAAGDHALEDELNEKRFNVGLNYWLTPSVVVKGGVEWRYFDASEREDDSRVLFQLSYGF